MPGMSEASRHTPQRNARAPRHTPQRDPGATRYQPLVIVLVAVCVGIATDRICPLPVVAWWAAAACTWIVWLALWRRGWQRAASATLLLALAAAGGAWHHCRWCLFAEDDLGCYTRPATQPICVEVVALKGCRRLPAPEWDPLRIIPSVDRTRVDVEVIGLRDGTRWRAASGQTRLLVDGHLLGVHAGDRLRVFAQLVRPRPAANPGGFDFAAYSRADRRRSLLRARYPDCVSVLRRAGRWNPAGVLERLRTGSDRLLRRYVDPARQGLAAAVLLGAREEIGIQRSEAFLETGTVHLLAISGLHVGIVAGALFLLMRLVFVTRGRAVAVVATMTVLYAVLIDARPPAVRATVLVLVTCLSVYLGRRPLAFNSLAAAALVVLARNPADLFRTGPQLSFLAVAGLAWFAPQWLASASRKDGLERMVAESRGWPARVVWLIGRGLRRLAVVSVIIWLLALPLVMARFHLLTPIALALNVVLWVPMAIALTSGFTMLVCGWLFPPLGAAAGWCCDGSLRALEWSIVAGRAVPGSHFWVPGPAEWWLLGFYAALGLLAALPRLRPPRRWCLALLAGWAAVGFAASAVRFDRPHLDCTVLSVGHGCAVVLELPSGQTMLYDAGALSSPRGTVQSIAGYLWSRGATHLDAVVLTHADADHYNALPELLARFSVGVIYVSPVMFEEENRAIAVLREAIGDAGVPIREIYAGDRLRSGDECRIEVLHPPQWGVIGGDNSNSIVMVVEYRGRRILLPGDLQSPGLEYVLAEEPIDIDVLLAPHHGSPRSSPSGLAAWSRPDWLIISGGNRPEHRATEASYRRAGAEVLHTGRHGAVRVRIGPAGLATQCFLRPD